VLKLSISDIIEKINQTEGFAAISEEEGFFISIQEYAPNICTAIHDGSQFSGDLEPYCLLSKEERIYEEDPLTGDMIESMPVRLVGLDSRYEYDLNRDSKHCVYKQAFGKTVWKQALPKELKVRSLKKHRDFYSVLKALLAKLSQIHPVCVLYDVHSYNPQLQGPNAPLFNVGSSQLDWRRYKTPILEWQKALSNIQLPNIVNRTCIDEVFLGQGYLTTFVTKSFPKVLPLATEIKKVYINETGAQVFPAVLESLKTNLRREIVHHTQQTHDHFAEGRSSKPLRLLPSKAESSLFKLDREIFKIAKGLDFLYYLNPINLEVQKKQFFKSAWQVNPKFRYRQLRVSSFDLKQQLFALPLNQIKDIRLKVFYRNMIEEIIAQNDLIAAVGTPNFYYRSLLLFGTPSSTELETARFLARCPDSVDGSPVLDEIQIQRLFLSNLKQYEFRCSVELGGKIAAKAYVEGSRVILRKGLQMTQNEANALFHHEVGVHVLTSLNAKDQPLKVLQLGLPNSTTAQEGLAVLSEMQSGYLTTKRLKDLAFRVIAVEYLARGYDFKQIYHQLIEAYALNPEAAFNITVRVTRGGGFTKDYVYLRGFEEALRLYESGQKIENLLVGKTSFEELTLLDELVDRNIILKPRYTPQWLEQPKSGCDEMAQFAIAGILKDRRMKQKLA